MAYTTLNLTVDAVRYLGDTSVVLNFAGDKCEIEDGAVVIITPDGRTPCSVGDWVIKVHDNRFYPVNPKLFAAIFA